MAKRFKKIKISRDSKVSLTYEQKCQGSWDEYVVNCSERPNSSFRGALAALIPYVVEMCELPQSYEPRVTVGSVSFSYGGEKEVMGATISASMALDNSNCPLNLNTPHKASESYTDSEGDPKALLSEECVVVLDELSYQAQRYLDGDREQLGLFDAKRCDHP